MDVIEITDKYNLNKVWVIKKTKCGHFYFNQKIGGNLFYTRFERTTKKHIKAIGIFLDINNMEEDENHKLF